MAFRLLTPGNAAIGVGFIIMVFFYDPYFAIGLILAFGGFLHNMGR